MDTKINKPVGRRWSSVLLILLLAPRLLSWQRQRGVLLISAERDPEFFNDFEFTLPVTDIASENGRLED